MTQEIKIEVETVEIKSEKNVIRLSQEQTCQILLDFIRKKKKLPEDAKYEFGENGEFRVVWKKEDTKSKKTTEGEKKPREPRENDERLIPKPVSTGSHPHVNV